jgi:hypothetical protein
MIEGLNDFSRSVADLVFAKHPEWRSHAESKSGFGEIGYLEITFPSPRGSNLGAPASYSSFGHEVTVALDAWHGHFGPDQGASWLADSLQAIDDLLAERLCVAAFWSDQECRGSELVPPRVAAQKRSYHAGVNRLTMRSWRGTYDEDREI